MQLVRNLLEIHGYRQVKFKICKENAGSLNHTTADPEQASAMPQQTQNKPQPHQSRHRARVSMLWGGGAPREHATDTDTQYPGKNGD